MRNIKITRKKPLKKLINENISLIITVISIFFIIITLAALRNQNEKAIKAERNERYQNAIEQLGNDKNTIVLDGIYTLHKIVKEDKSYIENVLTILCSYVKDTTTTENYQEKYKEKPSEPIQTILNILCINKEDSKIYNMLFRINFSGANLTGANLVEANLTNAMLWGTNLTNAIVYSANFIDAFLGYANLTGVGLSETNLTGADLVEANLTSAVLWKANLTGADLVEANFTGANLAEANLTGANFDEANLTSAVLWKANLIGADLVEANLTSANLREANLTGANLRGANLTRAVLWKANLTGADLAEANLTRAMLYKINLTAVKLFNAILIDADLSSANLKGAYSTEYLDGIDYDESFDERINSGIGKETDLSGISGYNSKNPPFIGKPIVDSYTKEEAEEIIKKYKLYSIN